MAESGISAGLAADLSAAASLLLGLAQVGGGFQGYCGLGRAATGLVRSLCRRLDSRPHPTFGIAAACYRRAADHLIELGHGVIGDVVPFYLVCALADFSVREHLHFVL